MSLRSQLKCLLLPVVMTLAFIGTAAAQEEPSTRRSEGTGGAQPKAAGID